MKLQNFILSFSALFAAVVLSSCSTSKEEVAATKTADVPKQEASTEPKLVAQENVIPEKKAEITPAAVPDKKAEVTPAVAPEKKAETAPAVVPAKADSTCRHTVKTGDNLWRISVQYYGKGSYWKKIYEANKTVIKKENFLEPGTVLIIPAVK